VWPQAPPSAVEPPAPSSSQGSPGNRSARPAAPPGCKRASSVPSSGCHRPPRVVSATAAGGQGPHQGGHTPGVQRRTAIPAPQHCNRAARQHRQMGDQRTALGSVGAAAHSSHWAASSRGQLTHHRPGFRVMVSANGVATQGGRGNRSRGGLSPRRRVPAIGWLATKRGTLPCQACETGPYHRTDSPRLITAHHRRSRVSRRGFQQRSSGESQHHPATAAQHGCDRCPPGCQAVGWPRSAVGLAMHPAPHLQASARRSSPDRATIRAQSD